MNGLNGRSWWWACGLVLALALLITVPTTGDIGLTWDEPSYKYSQVISSEWWEQWTKVRSWSDVQAQLDPDTLLFYWPYARHGINFHPPLAGQLNLLTHAVFGSLMKDIPSRRMASVFEYCVTIAILFGFLSSRYGAWVGGVAAASLLLMPRVFADGHIAGTDTPGLLLWPATAIAVWKGLHEQGARRWRVLVGVLLGLAFVEKMGAVLVLGPILVWLVLGHLPRALFSRDDRAAWVDGAVTTAAMLVPLGVTYLEIRRLAARYLPEPRVTDLFLYHHISPIPGAILLAPLAVWVVRRVLGRVYASSRIWGVERPALEIWTAILAFAPAIGWLGNPAWWRETLIRLAHYYVLNSARRGSLPDIQILYFGQTYEYSLPWHNAWVLIAITVPAGILFAAAAGLIYAFHRIPTDRLPLYFVLHLTALPIARMFETPAHDGVRLLLPTSFFLAALAGWGTVWAADVLSWLARIRAVGVRFALAALILGSAAWQLVKIHPFELSYYNELIGGPRGAWRRGFELTYWYDAFNDKTLARLNQKLPPGAPVVFSSELSTPPTFEELQSLGKLRSDIRIAEAPARGFPYMWLLTHDSKATAFTRLLFAMTPRFFAVEPPQLDGLRVATVAEPIAVSRAWALWLLTDAPDTRPPEPPAAPAWVRRYLPALGRFWGDGVTRFPRPTVNEEIFQWARTRPETVLRAAQAVAQDGRAAEDPDARRLVRILSRYDDPARGRRFSEALLRDRPQALVEAVQILLAHPDAVRRVMSRYSYTDPATVGGFLDRDLASDAR